MSQEIACSSCGGRMLIGFIVDRGDYASKAQQAWVEGRPESSFWTGLKTSERDVRNVYAFRCSGCGRLEFFAGESTELL
jgi:hypothetical protein